MTFLQQVPPASVTFLQQFPPCVPVTFLGQLPFCLPMVFHPWLLVMSSCLVSSLAAVAVACVGFHLYQVEICLKLKLQKYTIIYRLRCSWELMNIGVTEDSFMHSYQVPRHCVLVWAHPPYHCSVHHHFEGRGCHHLYNISMYINIQHSGLDSWSMGSTFTFTRVLRREVIVEKLLIDLVVNVQKHTENHSIHL